MKAYLRSVNRREVLSAGLMAATSSLLPASDTPPDDFFIEGYCSEISRAPGQKLAICVSCSEPFYSVEILRLGAEPRSVFLQDKIPASVNPIPDNASSYGCAWPVSFELSIPENWPSGYYQVRLKTRDSG